MKIKNKTEFFLVLGLFKKYKKSLKKSEKTYYRSNYF